MTASYWPALLDRHEAAIDAAIAENEAVRREAAHVTRRDGRAVDPAEPWPFRNHRTMAETMRGEAP